LLTHADEIIELTWPHVLTAAIGMNPPLAALRTSGSYWGSPAVRSPSLGRSAVGNADAATAAANDSVEVREYRSAMFCDETKKWAFTTGGRPIAVFFDYCVLRVAGLGLPAAPPRAIAAYGSVLAATACRGPIEDCGSATAAAPPAPTERLGWIGSQSLHTDQRPTSDK
jgi:hypothetical protein